MLHRRDLRRRKSWRCALGLIGAIASVNNDHPAEGTALKRWRRTPRCWLLSLLGMPPHPNDVRWWRRWWNLR